MKIRRSHSSSLALASALLPFSVQADTTGENDVWKMLADITIEEVVTETTYEVRKSWPERFARDIPNVEITGFAVPTLPGQDVRELILTSDADICPLCGEGGHNATLQVLLETPITNLEEGQRVTLRGTLSRVEDPETWQAARLVAAKITDL